MIWYLLGICLGLIKITIIAGRIALARDEFLGASDPIRRVSCADTLGMIMYA